VECVGFACNSIPEQASVNHRRLLVDASYSWLSWGLGQWYLHDPEELRAYLTARGPRPGDLDFVAPYYTSAQVDEMFATLEQAVIDLGGGDRDAGRVAVNHTQNEFAQTMYGRAD
jgi:hypothetical protein